MMTENTTPKHTTAVTVTLDDLKSSTPIPDHTLLEAFGPSSLGILIVSGLPPQFAALRSRVLANISRLAHLPQSKLDALVNEKAKYLVGWSHGKETLRDGVVDWLKGSYYVNTAFATDDEVMEGMRREWAGFDEYLAPNIWPDESDADEGLQGFRKDVEELVCLIVDVARYVARTIDRFAEKNVDNWPVGGLDKNNDNNDNVDKDPNSPPQQGYLEGIVSGSRTSKARLLHYFPSEPADTASQRQPKPTNSSSPITDSWCTVHKDHSCLTGLTSAAFFDETDTTTSGTTNSSTTAYTELTTSPSTTAGLYIYDRDQQIHKVTIPRDCLAFQTGEALELVTRGKLKAVPHFVRGVDPKNGDGDGDGRLIARNTLAVFTQPNLFELVDLDEKIMFGEYARGVVRRNTAV